ncbi:MAG TPA: hypothetical protein VGE93_15535 [Bryobacteraceae bacterium]
MRVSCLGLLAFCATAASGQALPEGLLPPSETVARTTLPSAPPGRSTVMGGQIEDVDLIRDQFALKVPGRGGSHTVKILFDERTQVYQNGQKISVLHLGPADHASIETRLDGTSIFAVRIHILSKTPQGQLRGQVVGFNAGTGELRIRGTNIDNTVTITVPAGTPVARTGQAAFSKTSPGLADLIPDAIVDVAFRPGNNGIGQANRIDVLAVPGAEFVFRGELLSVDLRAGRMSIATTSDHPPMDIAFDPSRFEITRQLHQGGLVKVTTRFDGTRYNATDILTQ